MIRLGFAVRVVGQPALRPHDGRRTEPAHLSVSLVYLRDILAYLERIGVKFYRVASTLLPHTTTETALRQIDECATELEALAEYVYTRETRLTLHLGHHIALGSEDRALAARYLAEIEIQAALLERLEARRPSAAPIQGVMVVHVGGPTGDAALQRFAARYAALSAGARQRLAVEHDSAGFSLGALLRLHQHCGVPVVFDYLHWQLYNPEDFPPDLALGMALATWPTQVRPKVHLSTARSEAHLLPAARGHTGRVLPPRPGQHADFIATTDLIHLLRAARGLPEFDIVIEAKAGDLALLRAREELARAAPTLAALLG